MEKLTIGKRLEFRRTQLGLTLDDIANEIGVARSTVQRYEKDSIKKIKLPVIEAIARVLGVSPAWLCCKSDEMLPAQEERPTPVSESGPASEFSDLMGQLTPEERKLIISQIKGILSNRE